jgi:branched-chain amino acid aminotransferase
MGVIPKVPWIWMDGKFIKWDEAQVHVTAHCLHYGTGVFEGIRCYETPDGPAVFRLDAHLKRFFNSASIYDLGIPFSQPDLQRATLDLVGRNRLGNGYVRPIAFFGAYSLDVWPRGCPVHVAIAAWPRGEYLGKEGLEQGVRVMVSSVRRFHSSMIPTAGKACGQYVNSVLAVQEAFRAGYDEAVLLNRQGQVAEGSGENLFMVKNGKVITNDAEASILMGITREAILEIAGDLGLPLEIRPMSVADVMSADEVFFTGTAVEVTPVREVDNKKIGTGRRGPVTELLQTTFFDAVHGKAGRYRSWLSYVHQAKPTATSN